MRGERARRRCKWVSCLAALSWFWIRSERRPDQKCRVGGKAEAAARLEDGDTVGRGKDG